AGGAQPPTRPRPPSPGDRTPGRTWRRPAARFRTAGTTARAGRHTRDRTSRARDSRDDTTRRASAHQAPALGARLLERIADGQALLARDPADIVEFGRHRHHATGEPRNLVAERTEGRDESDHLPTPTL